MGHFSKPIASAAMRSMWRFNVKKQLSIALTFCLIMAAFVASSFSAFCQPSAGGQVPASEKQSARPADKQSEAPPQAAPADKDDVVRISVTLVQVDAVVTDGKGRYITDLKPEDFEIREDGKRQHLTNFAYVEAQGATPPARGESEKPTAKALPTPPSRLRPEQVRRTIALVVDDLGLSFESTAFVRDALKRFVSQQMQPGDLVAIIRTGAGMGALQQFTSDKRLLYAAIERVRWNPTGRGGISAFAPMEGKPLMPGMSRGQAGAGEPSADSEAREQLDRFREDVFAVGTLGALNYVIRGLRELPGRKSVILFSDGFTIFSRPSLSTNPMRAGGSLSSQPQLESGTRVYDVMRRLTDLANRASVVIYTMDARGLQVLGLTAADNTAGMTANDIVDGLADRADRFRGTQEGLHYLADETGGFFIRNSNDLNRGIRRVLDDQRGYYLIGYVPEASSFRAARGVPPFHKVSVKVKRAGLHVRSRTGFYGVSDEALRPAPRTPAQQLYAALTSPFASGDIRLKLTSLFSYDLKAGAFMRSLLHIDPGAITFTKEADGQQKAVIDVVAFTFGDNGQVIDRESRQYTITVPEAVYARIMRQGMLYNLNVPIKKAGAYQLRVAVRDTASEKLGSANQFIEVPDIGKKRLTLSGIVTEGFDPTKPAKAQAASTEEGAAAISDSQSGPSQRLLRPGMQLKYGFAIYNATVDRATGQPRLEAQVKLIRDGKEYYTGKAAPIKTDRQTDWRQIIAGGTLDLGTRIEPGEYVLQVIITDRLAKEKYSIATQWIDFEVVK
jgi:VWFA-related protein